MATLSFQRVSRLAPVIGLVVMVELLVETLLAKRFGLTLTMASPLAYRGVLVELPGALWFLAALTWGGRRSEVTDGARRANYLRYAWGILGIGAAGSCWWQWLHGTILRSVNWQYVVATACFLVCFIDFSTRPLASIRSLFADAPGDLKRAFGPRGVVSLVAAVVIVLIAPTAADSHAMRKAPLMGQALIDWYDQQPKKPLPARYSGAPVVVATFVDYQCPGCASARRELRPVFGELTEEFGDQLGFVSIDFPLDVACNDRLEVLSLHPLACQAATIIRLHGRSDAEMDRLFDNQRTMTSDVLLKGPAGHSVSTSDSAYLAARQEVVTDAALGYELGVRSTPSFLIDGVLVERRPGRELDHLIRHVLDRRGITRKSNKGTVTSHQGG